ncbi:MAG: hypothetical protein AAB225_19650 [Acidobacteriota bacterium]
MPPVTADAVREQLSRILANDRFTGAHHLTRFLRFVVEETLAGRGDSVKESVVGLEVFRRGSDFDPRLDPIVRVQAAKLRSRLKEYYEVEGKADAVLIELPKGGYVPVFRPREEHKPAAPAESQAARLPARRFPLWAAIPLVGVVIVAVVWWALRPRASAPQLQFRQLTFDTGNTAFPAVSRDGKLVAYASDRGGKNNLDLWVQQVGGAEPIQVTRHEAADITPDFSPDGARIVFRSHREGGGLYVVSVLGTGERKLAADGWRPRFSPDGAWMVYQGTSRRRGGDLYVMPSGGGQARLVSIGNEIVLGGSPVWTPDGKHLIFLGTKAGEQEWWVVPAAGGTPVKTGLRPAVERLGITWPVSTTVPGDWNANRHVFAFTLGNTRNLWEAQFSPGSWKVAGAPRQITFGSALEDEPRVSQTGLIVFSSEVQRTHLWGWPLRAGDGTVSGAPVQLTHDASLPPGSFWNVPRFSATVNTLAYTSERSGNRDVWLRDLATGSEFAITANPWPEDQPLLSRDGSRVAYQSEHENRRSLQVAAVRSPLPKEVCPDCGAPEDWSADDRRVLFIGDQQHTVYLLDVASGQRTEVLRAPGFRFRHVTVSPDGRWLAVTAAGDPSFLVRLEDDRAVERQSWRVITKDTSVESVHWSHDGKILYFFSRQDDFPCLWGQRINPATGELAGEAFAVQHFHSIGRSPWSAWLSAGPTRLVVRLTDPLSNIFLASPQ